MQKLRPYALFTLVAVGYLAYVWAAFGTPLAWVTLGSAAESLSLPTYTEEGYDGQFTYFIARDPLGAAPLIDVPTYRYQRILLPALGWLLAFGADDALPFVLVGVNLVALALSVAGLEQLLRDHNVSRWYALGYGLSLGVLGTVRLALPEVLAYGLCIGGLLALRRERLALSIVAFALAALAKETTLLVSGAVGFHLLFFGDNPLANRIRQALGFGAGVLAPFVAWQVILWRWLGSTGIGSGGAGATGFEIVPFYGVARIWLDGSFTAFAAYMALLVPFVLLPTLWGLWRCLRDVRAGRWSLTASLLLFNAGIMLFVPFSTYREFVGILRFIVGLQLALILYEAEHATRRKRPLLYTTLWAVPIFVLILSDVSVAGG